MKDDAKWDPFVTEGLKNYSIACETIVSFRENLQMRLEGALEDHDWQGLRFQRLKRPGFGGTGKGALGSTIWAAADVGFAKEAAVLELGVWWRNPEVEEPVIAYAGFSDGPSALKAYRVPAPARAFAYRNSTYLYAPLPVDAGQLRGIAKSILADLDSAAKTADVSASAVQAMKAVAGFLDPGEQKSK